MSRKRYSAEPIIGHRAVERPLGPGARIADQHHVGMAGETEMRRLGAAPGVSAGPPSPEYPGTPVPAIR